MADERYEWLDEETAEQLLRGEPVDVPDEPARTQAARLTVALRYARRPEAPLGSPDGELAGEAAAVIAFRRARARERGTADQEGDFGIVRVVPAPRPSLASRLMQPVRYGVIAALAGFAFGGVAVGATTGLLPSPFDEGSAPATSVSGAPTGPHVTEEPPRARTGQPTPRSPLRGAEPTTVPPREETSTAEPTFPGATVEPAEPPPGTPDVTATEKPQEMNGKQRKLVAACRDHRAGTIDAKRLKRLEKTAQRHGVTVDRFCTDVLAGTPVGGSGSHGGQGSQGSQGGQGAQNGQNGANGPGGHGGQGGQGIQGGQSTNSNAEVGAGVVNRPYAKPAKPAKPGKPDKSNGIKVHGQPKQRAGSAPGGRSVRAAGPEAVTPVHRPRG
ncbi:hypothetical protein ABZ348_05555 [Streptomyces sp. NPDC005963]|uniref:hypothetical protein n=1 Tax=Streptomyces sp. NPDC005963 TaxID=3156721 RepID=UPI0033C369FE